MAQNKVHQLGGQSSRSRHVILVAGKGNGLFLHTFKSPVTLPSQIIHYIQTNTICLSYVITS